MKKKKSTKSKLFIDNGLQSTMKAISDYISLCEANGYYLKVFKKISTLKDKNDWILVSLQKEEKME